MSRPAEQFITAADYLALERHKFAVSADALGHFLKRGYPH
ncbi:MAG: hypothetical protein QG599_1914 [Pseudomonadota bacterium]|nr:hypothetical protein [Pseudomonadota bacterium]